MSDFRYYVETLNSEAHRAVIVSKNGKLVLCGEWQSRAWKATRSLRKILDDIANTGYAVIEERPFQKGRFAKNSGGKHTAHVPSIRAKKK